MRALVVMAALAALAGCSGLYSYYNNGGMTYTMRGTLTLTSLGATGYAYVTATTMSYPYSTAVAEPMGASGTQTPSYSVANLPAGTYTVAIQVTTANGPTTSGSYQVNGAGPVSDPPMASGGTWTMTIPNISIMSNTTLDATMQ